jgi:hypothetical protein
MIGDIRAYNEDIYKEKRRELGHAPLPNALSEIVLATAIQTGDNSTVRVPFVGRERIKGFRSAVEEVFVDSSGMGSPGEPALTRDQFLDHMLEQTKKHGTLWWGITTAGQFQVYVKAWKHKGA